jgi:PPP family 3-phenylpropionic acid transporter
MSPHTASVVTKTPINAAPLMGAFYFFYFALVGVYIIFLPKLLLSHGFSATEVGVIYASGPFMRFLLPFVFRHFIHLTHRVYQISLLIGVASTFLFFITVDHFWSYLIANLIFGTSAGAILPFVEAVALQVISKERYGKVRLWGSIGFTAIALFLGQFLSSPQDGILCLSILAVATLLFGYFIVHFDQESAPTQSIKETNKDFSIIKYWAFWLSAFLLQVSFGGFYNFFTIYETAHGISLQTTGYLWSFGVLCEIILFYYQGPLLKRNLLTLLKFAITTAILRWSLLYFFPDSLLVAYASQSLHAFSFALYYTAVISYVYSLYTQKKLAQQFLLGLTFGLGGSVGAMVAGKIYDYDSELLFGFEALMALLSLIVMQIHHKRKTDIIPNQHTTVYSRKHHRK